MKKSALIAVVLFALLALTPLAGEAYFLRIATTMLMYGVLAMSWNFIGGMAGYPSFASAAFYVGHEREPVGFHLYPSLPVIRQGHRPATTTAAPHLGEHNDSILAGLGRDPEEIAELERAGITGRTPA